MELTPDQIANWRKVLINMGMMSMVVERLSDEDIRKTVDGLQRRMGAHHGTPFQPPQKHPGTFKQKDEFANKIRVTKERKEIDH